MAANTHFLIRLEYKNRIVQEIDSQTFSDNINIGRSHDCQWVIPQDDQVASGHHAVITMQKGKLCLRDTGSRNGIFFQGQRVQERVLAPGDHISIGDCILVVESIKEKIGVGRPHAIQFLNGPDKGKIFQFKNPMVVIGSAPGCDMPILDQLVSQRHAQIEVLADGCWVKDLGSKNGTIVNGMPLKGDTKRMLKDSDILTISYFDMKFLDASVSHRKSNLWLSLGIVAVTLAVVFGSYALYQRLNPSSEYYLSLARSAAAQQNFDYAEKLIEQSRNLRNAAVNEIQRNDLMRSVGLWRNTVSSWGKAKSMLTASNWIEASHLLGTIESSQMDLWSWNDNDAVKSKQEAENSKKLLDAYLTASVALDAENQTYDALQIQSDSLTKAISGQLSPLPPYLAPLAKKANEVLVVIKRNIADNQAIEAAVARLTEREVPFSVVLSALDGIRSRSQGTIRVRSEKLLLPVQGLYRSYQAIAQATSLVMALDFSAAEKVALTLPSVEQCAIEPHVATLRKTLADTGTRLSAAIRQLNYFYTSLQRRGVSAQETVPASFQAFLDDATMKNVLACDSLKSKIPNRTRTSPVGDFDRLLGIGPFYDFIYALPAAYEPAIFDDLQFKPLIVDLLETFNLMDSFRAYLHQDVNRRLIGGALGKYDEFVSTLLTQRRNLVKRLYTGYTGINREAVIAHGIAVFLASPGDLPEDAPEKLAAELKKLRTPLVKLNADFNTATPEQAMQLRDSIINGGVPGDPLVRRMWSQRPN